PFVRMYKYSINPPRNIDAPKTGKDGANPPTNRWYIENSLETIGQTDPVSELWSQWYSEFGKEHPRVLMLGRNLGYISNVLSIKDGMNAENNGKVKRFRYGAKVFAMLQKKMAPEIEGVEPVNPFDPWAGMDLHLVVKKKAGFRNYDDSEWLPQKAMGTDE